VDRYDEHGNFMTPQVRYRIMREALGGEQIVTELDAFILCGGDPDHFDAAARRQVERDLAVLGYERRQVAIGVYGRPRPMWVRDNPWLEDEPWRDPPDLSERGVRELIEIARRGGSRTD
jgi:hypothetical protein